MFEGNNREEVLKRVERAFSRVPRPKFFGRGTCFCCECADFETQLSKTDRATIGIEQLGQPANDPMTYTNDAAFRYFLPAMARVALTDKHYWDQLLFHLTVPGRTASLEKEQAAALLEVVWLLAEDQTQRGTVDPRFEEAVQRLEVAAGTRENSSYFLK